MTTVEIALLVAAAFGAGALNAAAGGGSFLTLPALVYAGVPPVVANATGTAALLPGYVASAWGFREDIAPSAGLSLVTIGATSLVFGAAGAALLLVTGDAAFDALLPWLLLGATALFALGPTMQRMTAGRDTGASPSRLRSIAALAVVSLYGGYFNGGLGILLLAVLGLLGESNLNAMNATKGIVSVLLSAVSIAVYAVGGLIVWHEAGLMAGGAAAGGYAGARFIRKLPASLVRIGIVAVGVTMTVVFFLRA